jgi:hypothetical protein
MHRISLGAVLACALLIIGFSSVPVAAAQAQPVWVQCAAEAYETGVILTANTIQNTAVVDQAAAICSDWIQSGNWFGVDKNGSWRFDGYVYVCTITMSAVSSIDVYAMYGDARSAMPAVTTCMNARLDGNPVRMANE